MKEIATLFKLRSRTIDVKPTVNQLIEIICGVKHVISFPRLKSIYSNAVEIRKKQTLVNHSELSYNMIYGSLENQEKFAKSFHLILMTRMDLIREQKTSTPSQLEDPCTS